MKNVANLYPVSWFLIKGESQDWFSCFSHEQAQARLTIPAASRIQQSAHNIRRSASIDRPNHISENYICTMGFLTGKYRNYFVASGCILFGGTMFSLPGILRYLVPHQVQREKLTGSQRQRGMYMNAGRTSASYHRSRTIEWQLAWPERSNLLLVKFFTQIAPQSQQSTINKAQGRTENN